MGRGKCGGTPSESAMQIESEKGGEGKLLFGGEGNCRGERGKASAAKERQGDNLDVCGERTLELLRREHIKKRLPVKNLQPKRQKGTTRPGEAS